MLGGQKLGWKQVKTFAQKLETKCEKMPDFGIFAVSLEMTLLYCSGVSLFLRDTKELLVWPKWAWGPPEGPKKALFGRFRISEIITRLWPWEVAGGLSGVIGS